MSAMNAATRMKEGEYRDYYERKLKEGKHLMCALNVLRATLVHRMFSVIRRDEEYTRLYHGIFSEYEKLLRERPHGQGRNATISATCFHELHRRLKVMLLETFLQHSWKIHKKYILAC